VIYLVPGDTDKDYTAIRGACIDSVDAIADTPAEVSLSGLNSGVYRLHASDTTGNISEPGAIIIPGVGITKRTVKDIRIYPNPTNSFLTIEAGTSYLYNIEITSLNGQNIFNRDFKENSSQIDIF
jgi:hypothetical protein